MVLHIPISFRKEIEFPSTTYATFGLYQYPAKFIPNIPAYICDSFLEKGNSIIDPFAGYGTTGVVSRLYGINYEMWDLSPLLKYIHDTTLLLPKKKEKVVNAIDEMKKSEEEFIPDWPNFDYWYNKEFHTFLYKIWGYYHNIDDNYVKTLLTLPLLKITRLFSYDDPVRQKLSKSRKSEERVSSILNKKWKKYFFDNLRKKVDDVYLGIEEYQGLNPTEVSYDIKVGVDTLNTKLEEEKNALITSPPYLQAQEYIRYAKNDLFWLGHKKKEINKYSKLEIPYADVPKYEILSDHFSERRKKIEQESSIILYDKYFWGVLGALDKLSEKITDYLFLFVGRSSLRGEPVEIDTIFSEHLQNKGWVHSATLVDKIQSRRLFNYEKNPATNIEDARTGNEFLLVLERS